MIKGVRKLLAVLALLFISSIVIDEGKTIMLIGENLHRHLNHNDHCDFEIPQQHKNNKSADDEKMVSINKPDISCPYKKFFIPVFVFSIVAQDYFSLIWEPPKYI
ncbi:MAG TPA: hypothetical protein PLX08_07860 [Bacteroidales bacterium]|jgi:hypothetical protein|nr:hypothetical protein [Bacteroidales bacterium]